MSNEIQKDEIYLKGDLGTVRIASSNKIYAVHQVDSKTGSVTITISPTDIKNFFPETEDAEFEVIKPKELPDAPLH